MIKERIYSYLVKATNKKDIEISMPENGKFGHYSTNIALKLAKDLKKSPMELAENIAVEIKKKAPNDFFKKVEVISPGFINFFLSNKAFQDEFWEIYKEGKKWGKPKKSKKQTVVIDYSAPNIAKPMSVGHLRSTIIGQALYNVFKFSGWKTIGDNHLGDWGKQFGILIAAYKERLKAKDKKLKNISIDELMRVYVDYNAQMKENPELEERARLEIKKLQKGNKENIGIWNKFRKISLDEFKKIYKILGIKFDYCFGESFYNKMLPGIVKEALDKNAAVESEGATVIPVEGDETPLMIQKSDGAFLYTTTDLATVKFRVKKFKPDLILYAVGSEQGFYFSQLFKAVKKLDFAKKAKLTHVNFGLLLGEDLKKFSTRAGRHVSLEGLIKESIDRARKIAEEKQPGISKSDKEKIAKIVGVGAVKYNDLSQNRESNIIFDWDKMLNLEGNSAPYLQYTYARLRNVLRKARMLKGKKQKPKASAEFLNEPIEISLIFHLSQFPDVIKRITEFYYPHYLADYLFDLAKMANVFYQNIPVLKSNPEVREARLSLVKTVSDVLKTGLNLLGIEALEKM